MGQCYKNFDLRFFTNQFPQAPECSLKGTWQRGGFSGVFAEIGSA
jgi:hypothetical protein